MQNEAELRSEQLRKTDDSERTDKIFRIDTVTLLNDIRELEIKLSDHYRQVEKKFSKNLLSTALNSCRWLWLG